jgi:preprotein translocase subunit SecA
VKALFGTPSQRRLARAALQIDRIRAREAELDRLSDVELRTLGLRLRGRARSDKSLDRLLPEAFAAACVAARRAIGLHPFDVQIAGAIVMHHGAIAELATGEGKTLTAILPVFLNALSGKGAHVTTVNDYLARRDAEWTGPVYNALGLSVGVLQGEMEDAERARAYRCDITYGTASEFGFDFLRDRLKTRIGKNKKSTLLTPWLGDRGRTHAGPSLVQRGHPFALVDEADNVFIDDARTPLIISSSTRPATEEEQVVYRWADRVARTLEPAKHFEYDRKRQVIELLPEGMRLARRAGVPSGMHVPAMDKLYEHVEKALQAQQRLRRDQHYLVEDDAVEIVDEGTGRRMPDRHWSDGLHQAVEAKEGVTITQGGDQAAQITFQSYFRLYEKLAGMTGTAAQNWFELRRVYKLWVVCIPTNRPVIRKQQPDRVFPTESAKFDAVVKEVVRLRGLGRPVLVGTRSVERSETLSQRLTAGGIPHQVLNARHHEQEAQLIAHAGQPGQVTIATNMAGRGTDIKLGPGVAAAGGLHVLGTERHEAARIDRQLAGRAGRQGDPGGCQFYLSLEDELLEALGTWRYERLRRRGHAGGKLDWQAYRRAFARAQKRLERQHYRQRVDVLVHEKLRREVLEDLGSDPFVE